MWGSSTQGKVPAPTAKSLTTLCNRVVEGGYDLGIAFDGDGDMCIAVDSLGNVVNGDKIMYAIIDTTSGYYFHQEGKIILFIDEIHTLVQVGGDKGEVNPADMLKPYLARGEMQTIGATTTDEYRKYIEKDKKQV